MKSFLVFREAGSDGIKTRRWYVENRQTGGNIGYVSWYAAWRRYCFSTPNAMVILDAGCLSEIEAFLLKAMAEHKKSKEITTL
jgi:hypothetical protein